MAQKCHFPFILGVFWWILNQLTMFVKNCSAGDFLRQFDDTGLYWSNCTNPPTKRLASVMYRPLNWYLNLNHSKHEFASQRQKEVPASGHSAFQAAFRPFKNRRKHAKNDEKVSLTCHFFIIFCMCSTIFQWNWRRKVIKTMKNG